MIFDRTVPSAARTDAAVSSQDVSMPMIGPGTHTEGNRSIVVIVVISAEHSDWVDHLGLSWLREKITQPLWPLAPQGPCRTLCDGVGQVQVRTLHASHCLLLDKCRGAVTQHHADLPGFLESSSDHFF